MSFKTIFLREPDPNPHPAPSADPAADPARNYGYNEDADEPEPAADTDPNADPNPAPSADPAAEPAPAADPKPDPKPDPAPTPVYDWKKEIKVLDRTEVLKELGLGDFEIDLINYHQSTGDVLPYLEVKSVDYTKMDAEQILRLAIQKEHPGMSEKSLNFLYKDLNTKYYLDREAYPEGSAEADYGQEQMERDANKKRAEFIEHQSKFKAPEKQPDVDAQQREAARQQKESEFTQTLMNNDATVALKTSKAIEIGDGEEKFTYPVAEVDEIVQRAAQVFIDAESLDLSKVNLKEYYQSVAIGANLPAFLSAFGKHQQALAHKKFQDELENRTPKPGNPDPADPSGSNTDYGYKG